jgi:hypothetical protein
VEARVVIVTKAIVKERCGAIRSDDIIRYFDIGDVVEVLVWDSNSSNVIIKYDEERYTVCKHKLAPIIQGGQIYYKCSNQVVYYEHCGLLAKEEHSYTTSDGSWYTVNGFKKEVMFVPPQFHVGDKVIYKNFDKITANNQYTIYTIESIQIKHNQYKYTLAEPSTCYYEQDLIPAPKFKIGDRVVPICIIEVCDCHTEYIQSMRYKMNDGWIYQCAYMRNVLECNIRIAPKYSPKVGVYESINNKSVVMNSNPIWDESLQQYTYLTNLKPFTRVTEQELNQYLITDPKYLVYIRDKKKYHIITNISPAITPYVGKIRSAEEYETIKKLIEIQYDEDVKNILSKKLREMKKR